MKYIIIDLCNEFKCVADKCPDTCCIGWKIPIDKNTVAKMRKYESELGTPCSSWINENTTLPYVKLDANNKCPMLDQNNLCRVVTTLGPDALSYVCTHYPRLTRSYGNTCENYLASSCPEVIRLLMQKNKIGFVFAENNLQPHSSKNIKQIDKLYSFESAVRKEILDFLELDFLSYPTKMFVSYNILSIAVEQWESNDLNMITFKERVSEQFPVEKILYYESSLPQAIKPSTQLVFLRSYVDVLCNEQHNKLADFYKHAKAYLTISTPESYSADIESYRKWTMKYNQFMTNVLIYHSFTELIDITDYSLSLKGLFYLSAELCLFHVICVSYYVETNEISEDLIILILSNLARCMEHNSVFRNNLLKKFEENASVNAASIMLLSII